MESQAEVCVGAASYNSGRISQDVRSRQDWSRQVSTVLVHISGRGGGGAETVVLGISSYSHSIS